MTRKRRNDNDIITINKPFEEGDKVKDSDGKEYIITACWWFKYEPQCWLVEVKSIPCPHCGVSEEHKEDYANEYKKLEESPT